MSAEQVLRCAVVKTLFNIHDPSDSKLLWNGVRVLTRLIEKIRDDFGIKVPGFANHTRRAKRRMLAVMNAKNKKQRKAAYADPFKMANNVLGYSRAVVTKTIACTSDPALFALIEGIERYKNILVKMVYQTKRRVMLGETVPAHEKWCRYLNHMPTSSSKTAGIPTTAIRSA